MIGRRSFVTGLSALGLAACTPRLIDEDDVAEAPAELLPVGVQRLRFGLSPYYGEDVALEAKPLAARLSTVLGVSVELVVAEAYAELPELVGRGAVDVARLAPLAYVHLAEKHPIVPIAMPVVGGSPTYLGHLYARSESRILSLDDLKGRRVGWVSPESCSGYLFVRDLVRARGHDPDRWFGEERFYGKHPAVLDAVRRGEVDAGAAIDATSDWTGPLARPEGLRVIAKTARIPNDCVVARPGLDHGTYARVRQELLRLRPGAPGADPVLVAMRVNGWVEPSETRYDRVREVLRREAEVAHP